MRILSASCLLSMGLFACTGPRPQLEETVASSSASQLKPVVASPLLHPVAAVSRQRLQTITFGSCNKQGLAQPLWQRIAEEKPDLFIWTGDSIYSDTVDMSQLARSYLLQLHKPEYERFLTHGVPIIGVYDDHDYGQNNGDGSFAMKRPAQQLFLDFVGEAPDSPRRQQEGIYTAYRFGPPGQRIKILLLDTRYHRTAPGADGDMLGARQWAWLESELSKADAELLLVVSSTQILPFEHRFEKWADYPASRQRLLTALAASPLSNLLLISGDRHFAEFSQLTLPSGQSLFEVTASGLTHSYLKFEPAKNANSLRRGPILERLNYGVLTIEWEKNPRVNIAVKDINRKTIIEHELPLIRKTGT